MVLRNTHYLVMIKSFKHNGLALFFTEGSTKGIIPFHANKLRMQLTALDVAASAFDLNKPGYHLHLLKGKRNQTWSIKVSGNWRITFEFREGNIYMLDYEDYH